MKTWTISLPGLGTGDYQAPTRAKARYECWLALDGSYYRTFKEFISVARVARKED